jgi:hypothetical protein
MGDNGYGGEQGPKFSPKHEDLRKQFLEEIKHLPKVMAEPETRVSLVNLAKVQTQFITVQTKFMTSRLTYGSNEHVEALTAYSVAQTDMIMALQDALRQAGIV